MAQTHPHPLQEAADRAHRRLEQMTPEQLAETLKVAGILTPDGKLAPEYGGEDPDEGDEEAAGVEKGARRAG